MSIDCIFSLLSCLPNLEKFHVDWIRESDSDTSTKVDLNTMPALEPLKTNVLRLEVGECSYLDADEFPVEYTLYLVARLVNLQTIIIDHGIPVDTSGFTKALHEKYPHTIGISVIQGI
ncbi:hypothetical protein IW150_000779 [Coemansia sp. RSA 2607]|nr:hypothetical protein IW150_000779 [Coemansia sp. RSA 2607]